MSFYCKSLYIRQEASVQKMERSVRRDGESSRKRRRKSPRRSGVDAWGIRKAQQQKSRFRSLKDDELQGPPSRTRASLKRNLKEPSSTKDQGKIKLNQEDKSSSGNQVHILKSQENSRNDVCAPDTDQPSVESSTQPLPEKQTLELIIDTLQRRDTYEIFAEPVDPEEVEDYYEIIKEPMDFGTMRAKLHEGMYTLLEQFEHDVFLIPGNAMHFNSSTTIFFRQARAIHELAKKVFHVLRTDPERFESEFSGTRRRSCRRSQADTKDLHSKSFPKNSIDARKNSTATTDASSLKNRSPFAFKSFLGTQRFSAKATRHNLRDYDSFRGARDGGRLCSIVTDRRSTYRPHMDLDNKNNSKLLIPSNLQEFNYRESLLRFVKDLGPAAQMVAKRKLDVFTSSEQPVLRSQIPYGQMRPRETRKHFDNVSRNLFNCFPKPSSNVIDLTAAEDGEKCQGAENQRNRIRLDTRYSILNGKHDLSVAGEDPSVIGICKTGSSSTEDQSTGIRFDSCRSKANDGLQEPSVLGIFKTGSICMANQSSYRSTARNRDQDSSVAGISKTVATNQASENSNATDLNESSTGGIVTGSGHCNVPMSSSHSRNGGLMPALPCAMNSSRFAFDLGFLKSRMGKMNVRAGGGQSEMVKMGWNKDLSFTQQLNEEISWPHINNIDTNAAGNDQPVSSSSFDSDHLALQL